MKKLRLWAARIILLLAIGAIGLGFYSKVVAPASVQTETIQVPADEAASSGQLVPPEVLKAAGDRIGAGARDFGSDCKAAEDHYMARRGDARCKEAGGLELIYSDTELPQDPASRDAESPVAP